MSRVEDVNDVEDSTETSIDYLKKSHEAFQSGGLGGMALTGRVGYHAYYDNDNPLDGTNVAMHKALDEVLEMVYLDQEIIEECHGEVTPETMAAELAAEFETSVGHDFKGAFIDGFERALREQVVEEEDGR